MITEVGMLVVEKQPGQELVLVVAKTHAGSEGHSMGWAATVGKRLDEGVQAAIVPEILGQDATNREYLYHRLNQSGRWNRHASGTDRAHQQLRH